MGFRALFLTLIMVVAGIPSRAQDRSFDELIADAGITGLSIVSIENAKIDHTYYGGIRSSETKPPVTRTTVFEAESLSKPVVAFIALRLADEKTLDLDKPLAEYLPYPDAAHDPRYLNITARMVLTHTTGFPNWRNASAKLPILFEPGTLFSYSGEGFVFLQQTLEQITFKTLEELAWTYVFEPFEMTSSSFVWNSSFAKNIAVGHTDMGFALDKFTPMSANAAFSLHTTAEDYARFMVGAQAGKDLSRSLRRNAVTAQVDAGDGIFWGFGWGLQPTLDGNAIWHWGDNSGYKSFAYLSPGAKIGFVMFSNSANGMLILHEVFEREIGGPQTAVKWLNYEHYDDPQFQLGRRMHLALLENGMEAAKKTYEEARSDLPADAFEELALNSLGYRLLRQGLIDFSVDIFSFNAELYPRSSNVHDSLGEALFAAERLVEALEHYRESVRLDPFNEGGFVMVERISEQLAKR